MSNSFSFCEKQIIPYLPFYQLGLFDDKQQKTHTAYLSKKGDDQNGVRGLWDWKGILNDCFSTYENEGAGKGVWSENSPPVLPSFNTGIILLQMLLPTGNLYWDPKLGVSGSTGSDEVTNLHHFPQQSSERNQSQRAFKALSASSARGKDTSVTGLPRWHMGRKGKLPKGNREAIRKRKSCTDEPKIPDIYYDYHIYTDCWTLHLMIQPWK